eukprot:gene10756-biopygen9361
MPIAMDQTLKEFAHEGSTATLELHFGADRWTAEGTTAHQYLRMTAAWTGEPAAVAAAAGVTAASGPGALQMGEEGSGQTTVELCESQQSWRGDPFLGILRVSVFLAGCPLRLDPKTSAVASTAACRTA